MHILAIHPQNPQQRLVHQVVNILKAGGLIAYPTDSCYALGCDIQSKPAVERLRKIRKLQPEHELTLVCADLAAIGKFAQMTKSQFKLIKRLVPGPFTFILPTTREVPKRLWHTQRKNIGFRIPANPIAHEICADFDSLMLSTSFIMPGGELPLTEPEAMQKALHTEYGLVVDGGMGNVDATTVISWDEADMPVIERQGLGQL